MCVFYDLYAHNRTLKQRAVIATLPRRLNLDLFLPIELLIFFAILSLGASIVNGGVGYGYSSISVPIAVLVLINRIINPAYVLLEAVLNTIMLVLSGKKSVFSTLRRTTPILFAIVPGVLIGSIVLSLIAPLIVRFIVYAALLPLVLLQTAGFRRPIKRERSAGVPLGVGVGVLYSLTTISGPPIALFLNNQGLNMNEFKASISQIRIVESYTTCLTYFLLGLFTVSSLQLFTVIAPPIVVGLPLGMYIARKLSLETFRRLSMGFNGLIVGFGLSQTLIALVLITPQFAYSIWGVVIFLDSLILFRYFAESRRKKQALIEMVARRGADLTYTDGGRTDLRAERKEEGSAGERS